MKQGEFSVRVPMEPDLAYRARIAAARLNLSRVEFVRRAVADAIQRVEKEPAASGQNGAANGK